METRLINIFAWKRGCLSNRPSTNLVYRGGRRAVYLWVNEKTWRSELSEEDIADFFDFTDEWTKKKRENTQESHNAYYSMDVVCLLRSFCTKKDVCLYPKPCQETDQSFYESLRGGNLFKDLTYFERIKNNYQILLSYGEKLRLQPRWIISTTSICIILHVTLSLIQSLLK